MNYQEHKEEKYTIVNLCGVNYKATHRSSSSINNRFLLFLAQIRYFIKFCLKKLIFYIREVSQPILHHVMSNYEKPVILACSMCITLVIFYTIMVIAIDVIIFGFGLKPSVKNDDQYNHLASHNPNAGLISTILTHLIVYSFRLVVAMVSIILGTYCLSHVAMFIKKIMAFVINVFIIRIKDPIISCYFKIPEVEPVDPHDIV